MFLLVIFLSLLYSANYLCFKIKCVISFRHFLISSTLPKLRYAAPSLSFYVCLNAANLSLFCGWTRVWHRVQIKQPFLLWEESRQHAHSQKHRLRLFFFFTKKTFESSALDPPWKLGGFSLNVLRLIKDLMGSKLNLEWIPHILNIVPANEELRHTDISSNKDFQSIPFEISCKQAK